MCPAKCETHERSLAALCCRRRHCRSSLHRRRCLLPLLPSCSKQLKFGVMSPAEIVNTAEFHVYERALYKVRAAEGVAGRRCAAATATAHVGGHDAGTTPCHAMC